MFGTANRIKQLFGIPYPIVQGGMVWCSGWRLAAAVSKAGGLGLIGAGSMDDVLLGEHIQKCRASGVSLFGVNIPLIYPQAPRLIEVVIEEQVPIVFTSAGNPAQYTSVLKARGIKVVHVVSSLAFGLKAAAAGVDAIVGEGVEAGGHNGREETTTLCLIPELLKEVDIPVIAAGGIASGAACLAMEALGASGVQIGSLFASSAESSAHMLYKGKVIAAEGGKTALTLKQLTPVRMLKSPLYEKIIQWEQEKLNATELKARYGKGRSRLGIFEGDWESGEFEIGQVAAQIGQIESAESIIQRLVQEYDAARTRIVCG